jgi:hypothetical protein
MVGRSGAAARDIGNGGMLAQCCCSASVDMFNAGRCRRCPTSLDRRPGALDAERTEATEPGPDPTGESACAERR